MWQPSRMVVFGLLIISVSIVLASIGAELGLINPSTSTADQDQSSNVSRPIFPIDSDVEYEIWRGFECLETFTGHRSDTCPADQPNLHTGLDILAEIGTPVMSVSGGTVIYAGPYTTDSPDCQSEQSQRTGAVMPENEYGLQVIIESGDYRFIYLHLSRLNTSIGTQYVAAGDVIGYVGSRGCGSIPHLHFEVQHRGQPIDPIAYLADLNSP